MRNAMKCYINIAALLDSVKKMLYEEAVAVEFFMIRQLSELESVLYSMIFWDRS